MNAIIKDLESKIQIEKRRIANCRHKFGKSFFNPETVREGYGYKIIAQGSDIWSDYEGYHNVQKDRWTRICIHCGLEEHTNKMKPIITGSEPDFK